MANPASPQNTNSRDLDPLIKTSSVIAVKRAVVTRAVAGIDPVVGDVGVATHADDGAFVPGTDPIVVIGGQADETATDSVDEGDAGALRMTLNRRLITALALLDDSAFGIGTDYVAALGAVADDTSPDSVTEGDVGAVRMSLARALHVVNVSDVATLSNSASSTTSATLAAANANRIGLLIFNDDANTLFVKYGATASATSYTVKIAGGGYWEMPSPIYRGIVDGLWDVDGSGSARVTELT